jgi:hypothetical protein
MDDKSIDEKNGLEQSPSLDQVPSVDAGETSDGYVVDKAIEKRVLRKFDFVILPTVAVMYLFKYEIVVGFSEVRTLTTLQLHR